MKAQAKPAAAAGASKIDLTWAAENQPVWVMLAEDDPSGEACAKATLIKVVDEDTAQVKIDGEKDAKTLKGDKIYPLNNYKDYPKGYDDMVDMENLSEAELLNNLRIRFTGEDMIYTYVGPTLIVLNPYKRIDKLLVPAVLSSYQDSLLSGKFELKEHPPHVYAISATAMKNMFDNKKNQAIVISGESGAGKTENTKSAMKFLTSLGRNAADASNSKEENIEDKILACNPVLEAFGNAKTVRNDNSSRFGKYVSLLIEKDSRKIVGATITNYLLEKSRVVGQNSEERNYHIFYAFLRGASDDTLKKFEVTKNLEDWAFLKNAFKGVVPTVPDPELYKEVTDSFNTMKFSQDEQDAVWAYTAASLMIGNMDFDESTFTDNTPCELKNDKFLRNAAKVLNVDFDKLSKSLRFKTRSVGAQIFESTQKRDECLIFRDSLSKDLFNKLFNWLVKRLNFTVLPPEASKGGMDITSLMNKYYHIGLLDIFGFEIFNFNSIEQFCINFANEKLQQLYISYVFKGEEKEFILEGLKDYIGELSFKDNQGLIDMLDHGKLPGIFQMVDESCSVNATDQNLYDKIIKQFKKPEFPLTTQKIAKDTFIVKHTAKEVEYNINGFRAKNKDEISKTIEEAICGSTNKNVSDIWRCLCLGEVESEDAKNAKPNPKDKFLGFKFRSQMKELMDELNSCECHFIRCLKPNEKKQANFFLPQLVLQQIKYMGILDTIKVRKDSFPVRTPYKSFYEKYQELDKVASKTPFEKHVEKGADFKEMAKAICQKKVPHLGTQQILYGNNKMFLRVEAAKEIEKLRRDWENTKHKSARKIQKAWFYFKHHRLFKNMQKGVAIVQKLFKVSKEYLKFVKLRKRTLQIQGWWRRILFRRLIKKRHKFAIHIQAWWKKVYYSALHKKTLRAIKSMNRFIRGGIDRKKVRILKLCKAIVEGIVNKGAAALWRKVEVKAAKTIQRYARGYICRQKHKEKVAHIKWAKDNFMKNKIARRLQKHAKRFIIQASFKRIRKAASFIQGFMKTKWLSTLFQRLRVVSVQIQRAVRRWLIRNKIVRDRMTEFINMEGKMYQNLIINEQAHFFGVENVGKNGQTNVNQSTRETTQLYSESPIVYNTNMTENSMMMETLPTEPAQFDTIPTDSCLTQVDVIKTPRLNTTKEVDPYGSKKINLFSKVLDIEILSDTSLIYDPMWSLQVLQLQKDCESVDADLQLIEVGQAHTTVIASTSRVYSFGWNDRYQLGRTTPCDQTIAQTGQVNFGVDNFRPKTTAAGDDHNLALDHQGNLYVWGDNSSGQLGLGHCRETKNMTILEFLNNDSINEIKAKGNNSLAVTQSGKVYYWPVELPTGERIYKPAELRLPPKITINTASCGYNFAVLVAKNGLVFSFGKNNQFGQLGQGDTTPRAIPTLVETLKNESEIVVSVSCGFKHVVCKTKLGKVYTWGWGKKGQLGHGELENEYKPRMINFGQVGVKAKILQVQAGFKHSLIVLDNRKVLWWGTNASLECQASPVEVNLNKKVPGYNKDFIPVKVLCTWSKTLNATYISMADTRTIELAPTIKTKIFTTLASKLEENAAFNDANLPYIDPLAKHFSSRAMKNIPKTNRNVARPSVMDYQVQVTAPDEPAYTRPSCFESLQKARRASRSPGPFETTQNLQRGSCITIGGSRGTDTFRNLSALAGKPRNSEFISPGLSELDSTRLQKSEISAISESLAQFNKSHRSEGKTSSPETNRTKKPEAVSSNSPDVKSSARNSNFLSPEVKSSARKAEPRNSNDLMSEINKQKKTTTNNPRSPGKKNEKNSLDALNQKLSVIKDKMREIMATPVEKWSKADAEFITMAASPEMLKFWQNANV